MLGGGVRGPGIPAESGTGQHSPSEEDKGVCHILWGAAGGGGGGDNHEALRLGRRMAEHPAVKVTVEICPENRVAMAGGGKNEIASTFLIMFVDKQS